MYGNRWGSWPALEAVAYHEADGGVAVANDSDAASDDMAEIKPEVAEFVAYGRYDRGGGRNHRHYGSGSYKYNPGYKYYNSRGRYDYDRRPSNSNSWQSGISSNAKCRDIDNHYDCNKAGCNWFQHDGGCFKHYPY